MKLLNLTLANCGGFEQVNPDDSPHVIEFEEDITVIAGVNGVGKSTILHALSVIMSRAMPEITPSRATPIFFTDDNIHSKKSSLAVSVRIALSGFIINATVERLREAEEKGDRFVLMHQGNATEENTDFVESLRARTLTGNIDAGMKETRVTLAKLKTAINPPLAIYFTPKRQLPGQPRTLPEIKPFDPSIAYGRALNDREVELREFMHWFRTQEKLGAANEMHRLKVLDALRTVVSKLIPEFTNLRIQESPRLGFVVDKRGLPLYLHQLSDGERGLLALVFDLTRRLAIANPESNNPISQGVALVMIDEIELHLHPKWQRDVIRKLPSIFESCQFVITTHSPQVIGEVQARCVRILSVKDGRVISETPGMAYGADSNWILNVLMGADEMNKDVERDIAEVANLISERKLQLARKNVDELRSRVGNTEAIQKIVSIIERVERLRK